MRMGAPNVSPKATFVVLDDATIGFGEIFRMRRWSVHELHQRFDASFEDVEILPDYVAPPAWADRLVFLGTRRQP
jgi:hypothetical protein